MLCGGACLSTRPTLTASHCPSTRAHATVQALACPSPTTIAHRVVQSTAAQAAAADIHWANIAMSIGGLATVGALLISLFLLRQQLRDQREARQEKRREHASHISFWLTLEGCDDGNISQFGDGTGIPEISVGVHIVNTSPRPVMSVMVLAGVRNDIWRDASARDRATHEKNGVEWNAVAIPPNGTERLSLPMKVPKSVVEIVIDYKDSALIGELLFTDAAGVDWVRTHTGELIARRSARWRAGIPLSLSERDEMRSSRLSRPKAQRIERWARKLGDKLIRFADAKTS